ncbi:hypothetical protein CLV49_0606 [Labedella gwakjiensis]|uniref:Uncharacterized protein n=1 Tax=Labedella gwakjiensis TaxID=390269 RepID=A0A2P8GSR5_9MICO|nr:hypothetical protein [Labedella gwakjiensis]PSL37003.1 hypothetical protein CLV49_0606 [Labedella gwakjiensis]RUQ81838.1 hypothetical protein ELQ93_17575 [Labedella gwakjiensis]
MAELLSAQLHIQWANDPSSVPVPVNQMAIQGAPDSETGNPDGFFLTFGHVSPPIIIDPDAEKVRDVMESTVLPVVPVGHFFLTAGRLRELQRLLNRTLGEDNDGAAED